TLRMSDLDDLSGGQTVVYREDGDKIHLLYSGEYTNLYTIEDSVHERTHAWPTSSDQPPSRTAYDNFSSSHRTDPVLKTDAELADLEDRATQVGRLRAQARSIREMPLSPSGRSRSARSPSPHRRPPSPAERQRAEQESILDEPQARVEE